MKLGKKEAMEFLERNEKPIAVCSVCNNLSIQIYMHNDDEVIWKYSDEEILRKSKVKYKYDEEIKDYYPQFRVGNIWYNITDFIRVLKVGYNN